MKLFFKVLIFTSILVLLIISGYWGYNHFYNNDEKIYKNSDEQLNQATALFEQKEYPEALSILQAVSVDLNSTQYKNYTEFLKSKILIEQGKYEDALQSLNNFDIFITNNNDNKNVLNLKELIYQHNKLKANTLSNLGKYKESNDILKDIIEQESDFSSESVNQQAQLKYLYGFNNYQLGNYDEALSNLEKIVDNAALEKDVLSHSYSIIGKIYDNIKKDTNKALENYLQSFTLNPSIENALPLVEAYIVLNQYDEALTQINQELDKHSEDTKENIEYQFILYSYQGILLYKQNKNVESLHSFIMSNQLIQDWTEEKSIELTQNDVNKFLTVNKMYLLYVYYSIQEYELAQKTIDEIKASDLFDEDLKEIALNYETDVTKLLNIEKFQNDMTESD